MFGFDVFNYTNGYNAESSLFMNNGFGAEWADYPISAPTLYQHCLDDAEFPGWTYTIPEGETHLDQLSNTMRNDDASAIQVPEGWTVTLYNHGADGSGDDKHELVGPTNVECFTTIGLNDAITTIVAVNTGGDGVDCSETNQKTNTDGTCGVCLEGYVVDADEDSDTYGECIEEDNLLLYAGIGVAAILVLILLVK